MLAEYDINAAENLRARKAFTQVHVMSKTLYFSIPLSTLASVLMLFKQVQQFGTSILVSAGVVGIIFGFAAQKTVANLFAGFQIATTQPIRLDDVVIVEGEWGRIEEITLTCVVVHIWHDRRLVVPLFHFIERPFQNWTRISADLLGSVFVWSTTAAARTGPRGVEGDHRKRSALEQTLLEHPGDRCLGAHDANRGAGPLRRFVEVVEPTLQYSREAHRLPEAGTSAVPAQVARRARFAAGLERRQLRAACADKPAARCGSHRRGRLSAGGLGSSLVDSPSRLMTLCSNVMDGAGKGSRRLRRPRKSKRIRHGSCIDDRIAPKRQVGGGVDA